MTTLVRPLLLTGSCIFALAFLVFLITPAPAALAHELAKPRDDTRPIADFPDLGQLKVLSVCLLYTSPSPRDQRGSRMPSSA